MLSFTNQSKNPTPLKPIFKQGSDLSLNDLQNTVFTDAIFTDGTELKDVTFQQLQKTQWSNQSKNPTTLTNETKP